MSASSRFHELLQREIEVTTVFGNRFRGKLVEVNISTSETHSPRLPNRETNGEAKRITLAPPVMVLSQTSASETQQYVSINVKEIQRVQAVDAHLQSYPTHYGQPTPGVPSVQTPTMHPNYQAPVNMGYIYTPPELPPPPPHSSSANPQPTQFQPSTPFEAPQVPPINQATRTPPSSIFPYQPPSLPSAHPSLTKPHSQPLGTKLGRQRSNGSEHYTAPVVMATGSTPPTFTSVLPSSRITSPHNSQQPRSAILVSGLPLPHSHQLSKAPYHHHIPSSSPAASSELALQTHPEPHGSPHQRHQQWKQLQGQLQGDPPFDAAGRRMTAPELHLQRRPTRPGDHTPSTPLEGVDFTEGCEIYRRYSSPGKLEGKRKVTAKPPEQKLPSQLVSEQVGAEIPQTSERKTGEEEREAVVGGGGGEEGEAVGEGGGGKEAVGGGAEGGGGGGVILGDQRLIGGYDYPFVPRADLEDYTCPICVLILREPYLTDCCGNHFCRTCIKSVQDKGQYCPVCVKKDFKVMVNRGVERKIRELKVRCPQFTSGCSWSGTLGALENHIDCFQGNCKFVAVECRLGCGQQVFLSNLQRHTEEECPRRPYSCKFCGHKGVYEEIPALHWPLCKGYPVPCPNGCDTPDMPRRELEDHLTSCLCRTVQCEFSYAGCTATFPFNTLADHMQKETQLHLSLFSGLLQQLMASRQFQKDKEEEVTVKKLSETGKEKDQVVCLATELKEKEEELDQMKMKVEALQEDMEELRNELTQLRCVVSIPPFYFTVRGVNQLRSSKDQWFSPPFYTHKHNGYKMCISIDCGGSDEGTGTHVSVYANLMKGENDDDLRWPFRGTVTIQLLNQREDRAHCEHIIPFVRDTPLEIAGRVTEQEIAESGLGVPKFLHLSKLTFDRTENVEYLCKDTMRFCVLKVRLDQRA